MENFTLYHKNGEFKSLGWTVNNSILKNTIAESLYIPAGLLYINDNLKKEKINSYDNGVVNNDLFDKLYGFLDDSSKPKNKHNKTKRKKIKIRKRKNKTRRY